MTSLSVVVLMPLELTVVLVVLVLSVVRVLVLDLVFDMCAVMELHNVWLACIAATQT